MDSNTITPYKDDKVGKKQQVATMFNNISKTYDFLNHFLSFGIDIIWRKKAIRSLRQLQPKKILDVATGTGDFAFEAINILKPDKIVGVDISEGMLAVAKEKIAKRGVGNKFEVVLGDSEGLPFDDGSFDAVTVAFGVRNFENLEKGLADICRVLRPGGKAVILEFSNPKTFPMKQLYSVYSRTLMPFFGRLFSKDREAYSYLPESVVQFPDGERFTTILDRVGFSKTVCRPQTFGICSIYIGTK
ncbi:MULTISPECIES: bifunctional demethylmenaquinone methyltransferase/2-methoxy-6-polyprenyl-1,4-benzoquinol methylase UbiE [Olivibacter]|jgi:demethylmenaquinone methyltransferase/2-methoxy-6-polyprenyl-1,4-benzoquinol methylase|uniref:Demethylmenaquinone methyltransferase n=3 Tax=Sphingobacteriaceae TaxID=84566 RepID=F4C6E7_SPHS2|nr:MULTISPECIES: bifunctional demethylmenaquinone methyltransferase/2-methoxy-6-polyprenyl-1,4-benzoquinol methylase UbiE [Olivibacter]MCL4637693.1 bifunctional demethylmenaquinone methyltransferase/2-methoxy-6-polyprenyl-1,4-benzoquinol methylase UbiE [Olivibacter sp. UJ_SKK_5.1]MDX3915092.1 bifunctional demethylmenaquinone methyltransferase/2-methoxy-6-polyprenyl-1,4-benzoquinol methylase UbiE [Pseudosphingobacterium sp.]QEL03695.1 bifunctional demethylmenaquinone methyltransferase/2-methoxy-6